MLDRRGAALTFWAGFAALVLGVAAAFADAPALALAAGLAGGAAAAAAVFASDRSARQAGPEDRRPVPVAGVTEEAPAIDEADAAGALPVEAPARSNGDGPSGLADPDTGMFNEQYFRASLDARISAARRHLRPVAVVLVDVVTDLGTGEPNQADARLVADAVLETLREADTACRLDDGRFALVLEDTPENGAVWTVERVRRALTTRTDDTTMWAGIACYPAHAFDAGEILDRSARALVAAREWSQDRIEVATVE